MATPPKYLYSYVPHFLGIYNLGYDVIIVFQMCFVFFSSKKLMINLNLDCYGQHISKTAIRPKGFSKWILWLNLKGLKPIHSLSHKLKLCFSRKIMSVEGLYAKHPIQGGNS